MRANIETLTALFPGHDWTVGVFVDDEETGCGDWVVCFGPEEMFCASVANVEEADLSAAWELSTECHDTFGAYLEMQSEILPVPFEEAPLVVQEWIEAMPANS